MDINTGGIADSFANFVWEPAVVKVRVFFIVIVGTQNTSHIFLFIDQSIFLL